jgi:hypothetical protein
MLVLLKHSAKNPVLGRGHIRQQIGNELILRYQFHTSIVPRY